MWQRFNPEFQQLSLGGREGGRKRDIGSKGRKKKEGGGGRGRERRREKEGGGGREKRGVI